MSDIFLSYASQDIEQVRSIVAMFEAQGWSVWWDRALKPGETWPSVIERQLKQARCVVVGWSESAVDSPWVRMEANKARERNILVPFLLENVRIPPEFGPVQAVALYEDREAGERALLEGVKSLLRRSFISRLMRGIVGAMMLSTAALAGTCLMTDFCDVLLTPGPSDRSVAILDFENRLPDPHLKEITSIFVDELRETLAEVEQQPVAARAATRALPKGLTPDQIGRRLRARWLVAGTISGSPEQIELSLEVIDADSGYLEDAKRYVAVVSDLERMRRDISTDLLRIIGSTGALPGRSSDRETQASSEAYVLYLSGKSQLRQRKVDEAEAYFLQAKALEPGYPEADAGLCQVFLARFERARDRSNFETAEEHCTKALGSAPLSSDAGLALGELYLLEGSLGAAEHSFAESLRLNASSAGALIGLARVAEAKGEIVAAERFLREGVIAQRGYWRPYNELGIFLLGQGRTNDALAVFDQALLLAPDDTAVLNNLAVTYVMAGEFDKAVNVWSRVVDLDGDAVAHGNLGSAYYWLGDLELSVAMFEEAVRLHPEDFRWWSSLGDAQLFLTPDAAMVSFERALELTEEELQINTDNVEVLIGRAPILAALGRADEARVILKSAGDAISENPSLAYMAAVAAARLGNLKAAGEYVELARSLGYPEQMILADPTFNALSEQSALDEK